MDFGAINLEFKKADAIIEFVDEPEKFLKAIKGREVTEMTLRFVIKELLRRKTVEKTSGDTLYFLKQISEDEDRDPFLEYLHTHRKGDLEKLCMGLRACRYKDKA